MLSLNSLKTALLPLLLCAPLSAGEIKFVYPAEGASIPDVPKTFVFGNVSPATAPFTINGEKITVHTNGGFIAYIPISSGDFVLAGMLADGTTAQRLLRVKGPPQPKSGETVWLSLLNNSYNTEVLPSEYIKVQAVGTPGREAEFSIDGIVKDEPMLEVPAGSGRYIGSYRIKETDAAETAGRVRARFRAGLFGNSAEVESRGQVKILKAERLVETSTDTVILRNYPDGGYMMFLPRGVKLITNGLAAGMRRVQLSPADTGWVDDSKVQPAAAGQLPVAPFTETGAIRLKWTETGTQISIGLYDRVPYVVEETVTGLRLTLFYTNLHTNWVVYDSSDTFVKNVAFRQAGTNKAEIDIETDGAVWGYNVAYAGKALLLDLRRRPRLAVNLIKPLTGLSVVLDPGHSPKFTTPYDGAIGPMNTYEFQVNLAIAQKLKEKLLTLGASVQMTRNGDENVPLADRPKLAKDLGGDIFISIHNNAIGDGEDPFAVPRGFQIYYYHRHSRDLAERVHAAYVRNIPLPDEGLRYGDYLVARLTWMPAILTESAYMIFPRQEEMLNSPSFQEQFAQATAEGILKLFEVRDQVKKAPETQQKNTAKAQKRAQPEKALPEKVLPRQKKPAARTAKSEVQPVKAPKPKKVKNAKHP
ncbi:MAG TPA: hypothetical protein DCZ92_10295 [Elusimicrobia bacterium]|nr:MAG: hypothetical protein A2016_11790 [Elusimicrobia bacterium GWF2_62_30]HBA61185.1 hypothetical protein [Elusimicrobiota bacterium]